MPYVLQFDFPYEGPWGEEMASAMADLARSIAREPGLRWKLWIENRETGEAGGIYLFEDLPSAEAYLAMHTRRLGSLGIPRVNSRIYAVNEALSRSCRAPV